MKQKQRKWTPAVDVEAPDYTPDDLPDGFVRIPDFPAYWINRQGEVWSAWRGHVMSPSLTGPKRRQYRAVILHRKKKAYHRMIHRLMATVFLPNPNNLPMVRHLNDVSTDNRLDNLAWGTRKDNIRDAKANGVTYGPASALSAEEQWDYYCRWKNGHKVVDLAKEADLSRVTLYRYFERIKDQQQYN